MKRKTPFPKKTLRDDAARIVEQCPVTALRALARGATQIMERALSGLSFSQMALMAQIAAQTDDSLAALADKAGLDPSTMTRNLQALERLGWVEIAHVENDLRRRAVWLTEAGARELETAVKEWRKGEAAVWKWLEAQPALADLQRPATKKRT